ncbi:MAG TPA: discoidin domain-containing protein [Blastocatellia bacterium]|nr:discoidin domain-containing protein [Blastocatellia bacterium]HMY72126.1 discoidin domain-containing protein [Blastocatellia bacterium]HMZ18215.1 discoidin domain-containing protein [Blastocatellia bacterium]HNG28902.1 discoidin domain-containing protein [Blastocatellia bacterium]
MVISRKAARSAFFQSLFCLLLLGWLTVQSPNRFRFAHPQAQSQEVSVALNVVNASLPVTIGVPLGEAANVTDAAQLGVTDSAGNAVPAQIRVLARWGGTPEQTARPIKWLLVDFKPVAGGTHVLTRAAQPNNKPVSINDQGATIRAGNSQIEVEFPKQGESLIKNFKLGGSEQLRAPVSAQTSLPRRVLINRVESSPGAMTVTDATRLRVGDEVQFEHVDALKWDASAGSARLVTFDQSFAGGRRYRVGEGTPEQEDLTITSAEVGDLRADAPMRFNHPAGTVVRDLSIEQERATIKSISGQTVQFSGDLKVAHSAGEKMIVVGAPNETATAVIEKTSVEEANALRAVIRQDGFFRSNGAAGLAFTLRYYVYADQPFVRVRLRVVNRGAYGFGAQRSGPSPFAQHALLRSLSVLMPTASAGSGLVQVLKSEDARSRLAQRQSGASLVAGQFEIGVPEFVENYPKALAGNSNGLRFDVLPDNGSDYVFDGARAKTTDFYLGRNTIAARALTVSPNAVLDPAYVAKTGAVRPAFVEKRNWAAAFKKDAQLAEAATRAERLFASAYAVEASEAAGSVPAQSAFEYRQRGEQGEQFGWHNFGDLAWGDGYANVHYDLPFLLLREALRSGDARAFQLGGEMARYRADWGQLHADDFLNDNWNLRGMAFYEKGDHGSFREPVPSHMWIEGLWLYWALTGDEAIREAAMEGSEAFARMNFTYESSLSWNEPRWLGWPTLGLIAAWRYTGESRFLNKAGENVALLIQTEESYGRRGFYIGRGMDSAQAVQPWAWTGYTQAGVIEYWRETGDTRTADYIVRVADWLISKGSDNPPLKPGLTLSDGNYLPAGMSYFWYPDKLSEDRSVTLAGLSLPVLVAAARITNRDDLRERAKQLFQDFAFYRDLAEGRPINSSTRAVINFRSVLYAGSSPKVYGQMGQTVTEYLPELVDSIVRPSRPLLASTPRREERVPSPVFDVAGLTNLALKRPAKASSTQIWPDTLSTPDAANDGELQAAGKNSIWHSASNTGQAEWWQVDLGRAYRIQLIEILFRADQDQPLTRRNFEVRASNDPGFGIFALLAAQGDAATAFQQPWRAQVADTNSYRYVRVQKSKIDRDPFGQAFFNLGEVRLFGAQTFPETPIPAPPLNLQTLALSQINGRRLLIGQTLAFKLADKDERGQPLQLFAYNLPENARFDPANAVFQFTPVSTQAGNVFQITFRVQNAQQQDSFARMDVAVMMDGAPNLTLLAPNAGARLTTEQTMLISWSMLHATPMAKYQIRLSTDGGASYPIVIAELPGYANQYQWLIPRNFSVASRAAVRLLVKGTDTQNRTGVAYSPQDLRVSVSFPR